MAGYPVSRKTPGGLVASRITRTKVLTARWRYNPERTPNSEWMNGPEQDCAKR